MVEGIYRAFNDYGVGLEDIKLDSSLDYSSFGVNVDLSQLGDYKFGFEHVEWSVSGISDEDVVRIPDVLSRGEGWLRSIIPNFAFKQHGFNYYCHSLLSEGTSQEFLREFSKMDIPGVGENLGSGLIFHWLLPEQGWRMNLTIDHSNLFPPHGLFIEQDIIADSDNIDYVNLIVSSQALLRDILAKVGLEFESED